MIRSGALLAVLALAACTGDDITPAGVTGPDAGGETQVTGTIDGVAFDAKDAISRSTIADGFEFQDESTVVLVTDFTSACANQASDHGVANGQLLAVVMATVDANGSSHPLTAPGTFGVTDAAPAASSSAAQIYYEKDGANCFKTNFYMATSGTVVVTAVDGAGTVSGTFSATFPASSGNQQISGGFIAPQCAALDPNRTPLATCQ